MLFFCAAGAAAQNGGDWRYAANIGIFTGTELTPQAPAAAAELTAALAR